MNKNDGIQKDTAFMTIRYASGHEGREYGWPVHRNGEVIGIVTKSGSVWTGIKVEPQAHQSFNFHTRKDALKFVESV